MDTYRKSLEEKPPKDGRVVAEIDGTKQLVDIMDGLVYREGHYLGHTCIIDKWKPF